MKFVVYNQSSSHEEKTKWKLWRRKTNIQKFAHWLGKKLYLCTIAGSFVGPCDKVHVNVDHEWNWRGVIKNNMF